MLWIYVPQNSGLADELRYWGWYQIKMKEIEKYQRLGFEVHWKC